MIAALRRFEELTDLLLLFGGAKIPQLMKGLGKGIHEYKKGLSGEDIDDEKSSKNNDDK